MTSRDIVYGRQGGRVEKWKPPAAVECRPPVNAECPCGRWVIAQKDIGRKCWTCGERLVLVAAVPPEEPETVASAAEQERGLAAARRVLGAA